MTGAGVTAPGELGLHDRYRWTRVVEPELFHVKRSNLVVVVGR